MINLSKILPVLGFFITFFVSGFSQDKTSTKQEHILIAIEDSLRGRSFFGEDSAWINEQLQLHNEPFKKSKIKYKLVKIGKRKFTEGPRVKLFKERVHVNYKYGDSVFSVLGQKFYTYIGNSSWGYYPEYHLNRVEIEKSYTLTEIDSKKLISLIELSKRDPNTCEHGWDIRRGMACQQCLHGYKMQHDSNYRKVYALKLNKINPSRYCKHGFDTHSSGLCIQCRHEERMKEDSTLMPFYTYYPKKDSLNPNPAQIIMDCNHGHICCETTFCDCCPKHLRKKDVTYKVPSIVNKVVCKHGHDQELGQACPQCSHEYRMSKDSTLKPYSTYFEKIVPEDSSKIEDCIHAHDCCDANCPCCPQEIRKKRINTSDIPKLKISGCAHSHDCCSSSCECCPNLTKKERRKLIRKKKRIYRRNMRKYKG